MINLLLVCAALSANNQGVAHDAVDGAPSAITGSGDALMSVDMNGYDLTNADDIYSEPPATDAAPRVTSVQSQPVFAGVNAANTTGANLLLSGTPGAINITGVTKANTTGDTIAFAYTLANGTSATVTLTEGVDYDCDGAASDIECVCNLYDAVVAHATLGTVVNTLRTDATCSDERLFFGIVPGVSTWLVVTPSDNTNTVRVAGTDGEVQLAGTTRTLGDFDVDNNAIYFGTAGQIGGNANGDVYSGRHLRASGGGWIYWNGSTAMAAPANGAMILSNSAQTQGIKFDTATTDGRLILTDEAGVSSVTQARSYVATDGFFTSSTNTVDVKLYSPTRSTTGTSPAVEVYSGGNTNAGDYDSGKVSIYTGDTTTDGDSGDVEIYTGAAGAGTADAGDVKMSVNGAPGSGTDVFQALGATGAVDLLKIKQADAAATCTVGQIVIDTGGATVELCYCSAVNTWSCAAMAAGPAD